MTASPPPRGVNLGDPVQGLARLPVPGSPGRTRARHGPPSGYVRRAAGRRCGRTLSAMVASCPVRAIRRRSASRTGEEPAAHATGLGQRNPVHHPSSRSLARRRCVCSLHTPGAISRYISRVVAFSHGAVRPARSGPRRLRPRASSLKARWSVSGARWTSALRPCRASSSWPEATPVPRPVESGPLGLFTPVVILR